MSPALPLVLVTLSLLPQAAAAGRAEPEVAVSATLEELRKGELLLDADALDDHLAASFTLIEGDRRVSGSFTYLESFRRLRERGAQVKELRFEQVVVRVYGASAIASYRYVKTWKDAGARHTEEGWSSDVFELRDDGAWILVHRHRGK
ncbi:MAG TPA: nuclear transport factor 2 family protein [Thermoanaerobaculaceae bacterium]|nr:nuclear transport factor 2 family protein [Thermoanaerobaculaceae bacterium]